MTDYSLLDTIVNCRKGSVVAPAGCGKTEQIARAVMHGSGRRLVLTHTLAGVDALRTRLRDKGADPLRQEVVTIAAWALSLCNAFPTRSGLSLNTPSGEQWETVHSAVTNLIGSGAINGIIRASYTGVLVDEYQDCTRKQHQMISALAKLLPCCVFGDPLQAIFNFRRGQTPDWDAEVVHEFPGIAEFRKPWRWDRVGNSELGAWLLECRDELYRSGTVDLLSGPPTLRHRRLTGSNDVQRRRATVGLILKALDEAAGEKCIVIGESQNEAGRALLARDVKAATIEPVACKRLTKFVEHLESCNGVARLDLVLDLVKGLMVDAQVATLKKAVNNCLEGTRRKPLDSIQAACLEITRSQELKPILVVLENIPKQRGGWIYRRELHSALCCALREVVAGNNATLAEAVWDVQNRRRHAGRRFGSRNIGSTLLVKGLEFDHAIIVDGGKLKRNDLYVALTRGSRSVTVISESPILRTIIS